MADLPHPSCCRVRVDNEYVVDPPAGDAAAMVAGGRAWYTEAPRQRISRVSADGTIASFALSTPVARLGRLAVAPNGDV